jgi:ribose transport system ATP-binding protein
MQLDQLQRPSGRDGDIPIGAGGRGTDLTTPIAALADITKAFGPTVANRGVDFSINPGEVVGFIGGNGAGKSTFMRILCGVIRPDAGTIALNGQPVALHDYSASFAQASGLRMVHQELSLCMSLSVVENFYLEAPESARLRPFWQSIYRQRARAALDSVFPDNGIDFGRVVGSLPIGQRQMIEIARAAAAPGTRLLILDEPTSSLGPERSRQLREYLQSRTKAGMAFIFISHKLHEIMAVATRVMVLRNGQMAWSGGVSETDVPSLVRLMGGPAAAATQAATAPDRGVGRAVAIQLGGTLTRPLGRPLELHSGQIIGLAGLEGSGQKELLHAIFAPSRANSSTITLSGKSSFVSGDRQREGVLSLWSVLENIAIGRLAKRLAGGFFSRAAEEVAARGPAERLRLDPERFPGNILTLSGGNQQKAMMARALLADSPTILLDDPTRGVDVGAKADFYGLIRDIASEGKLAIWHSTEDAEFLNCDRVLVFAHGQIVAELSGPAISEEAIVNASFTPAPTSATSGRTAAFAGQAAALLRFAPYLAFLLIIGVMMGINPDAASVSGIDLLLGPAVPVVLVALAQMFVIGGGEVDLGVGAFAGLVNVLSATLLHDQPALGVLSLLGALAAYSLLGAVIRACRIPAIVVTLGASFIWLGIGLTLQPVPGGSSPDWLTALFSWVIPGLPTSAILIAIAALAGYAIDRAPLGVTLRAFGDNPGAMERSGWQPLRYAMIRYFLAGVFAMVAGLSLTAINTASDINAGSSFTLLSVAAVVMGGCSLMGGLVAPVAVVVAAVTLALVGGLLGTLDVSTDNNAAVQGLLLILLLIVRTVSGAGKAKDG